MQATEIPEQKEMPAPGLARNEVTYVQHIDKWIQEKRSIMSVGRICVRDVDIAETDDSVQQAALRMNDRNVGTLVVLSQSREPIGMVTDRDLAVRVLAEARDPVQTRVVDVMTMFPHSVREETSIEKALRVMRAHKCRRLPVVDPNGKLVGLVSLDDILDLLTEEFAEIRTLLHEESPHSLAAK
jgi:CBS domain-containing protein